ncbi:MAG: hypothetical protein QOD10_2703 [Mycobacterium sp.]|jgi:hypothetical protein|nr:hypothetical protein [Mycobacterium sp.]
MMPIRPEVARQIVKVVDTPKGSRPFRVYVDPADDGAEDVFRVGDRVRQWFYQRIGMLDLLSVGSSASPKATGRTGGMAGRGVCRTDQD